MSLDRPRGRRPACPSVDMVRRADTFRLLASALDVNLSILKASIIFSAINPTVYVFGLVPRSMELGAVLQCENRISPRPWTLPVAASLS